MPVPHMPTHNQSTGIRVVRAPNGGNYTQQCACDNGRVRCPHYFRFLYLNLSRGTERNWSVLAFRFASLPSPPIPATAQALTLPASQKSLRRQLSIDFQD